MNKARRTQIEALAAKLEELKGDLEILRDEEQDYYDNMPESLQGGEKGDAAQQAVDELESAISSMDDALGNMATAAE